MTDGNPSARRIHSASDETWTAARAAPLIQSASSETAVKRPAAAGQRSPQSGNGSERATWDGVRPAPEPAVPNSRPVASPDHNASRRLSGPAMASGEHKPAPAPLFGSTVTDAYAAVYSEMVQQMQRAAMRQGGMLKDLSQTRAPGAVFLIGQRYLMQGFMDLLGSNMRVAQASIDAFQTASRAPGRRGA